MRREKANSNQSRAGRDGPDCQGTEGTSRKRELVSPFSADSCRAAPRSSYKSATKDVG